MKHQRFRLILLPLLPSLLLAFVTFGAGAQETATMVVDATKKGDEISPYVFGQFIEHLGRCIYGGIFDPGSPLSDGDGLRTDVIEAIRRLQPTIMRWPGGNFVSGYHWRDGVGPRHLRPMRRNPAWDVPEYNHVGTDEFLAHSEVLVGYNADGFYYYETTCIAPATCEAAIRLARPPRWMFSSTVAHTVSSGAPARSASRVLPVAAKRSRCRTMESRTSS